ncbi:MAG: dockerin type I repeat-containing protein [Clostridia bacterium]|nr:dockerin type I repeat-containing protein [Clostridia bacterium]
MKRAILFLLVGCMLYASVFTTSAEETTVLPADTVLPGYGDMDLNGRCDATDALTVLKFVVGKAPLSKIEEYYADVNGDEFTNAGDALDILKMTVGKINRFTADKEQPNPTNFEFEGSVSYEVLCNYLSRATTISQESGGALNGDHVVDFILDTGAKYICRAATCWWVSTADYATYPQQKDLIDKVHAVDPDVVFEACIFECISGRVNDIAIPAYVFEAFDLPVEERNFSFDAMCFDTGTYMDQWGEGSSVPDITQIETQLFFYYRACEYLKIGYEALHMGQVHLIGSSDPGWENWTIVLNKIREFAKENCRRKFVFINAHTYGMYDIDGKLMFDFHMYPSRPAAEGTVEQAPTETNPQKAFFDPYHNDSIYGKSWGGLTQSGWECDSLPYLVELDNYGNDVENLYVPDTAAQNCWGMDEISWYANQPDWYRHYFLKYAYDYVTNTAPGDAFFAMPGQRVATLYDENKNYVSTHYFGYSSQNHPNGFDDQQVIKEIWSNQ